MKVEEILGRLPRRFEKAALLNLCALFQFDASGLTELYERLPVSSRWELQCRAYRRAGSGLEFDPAKFRFFSDEERAQSWATRLSAAFRKAQAFPIGKVTRESILSIHETLLPQFETVRFREAPMAICNPVFLGASDYYRDNYGGLGFLVRLSPRDIATIPTNCRWIRWEFAKVESYGESLRAQLPSKEGEAWIATWSPEGNDVGMALDEWLRKLNAGPVGPPAGWAGELFNEFCQIHPMSDGNGRVGAILFNSLLRQLRFSVPSLTVPDVCYPFPPRSTLAKKAIVEQGFGVFAQEVLKLVAWHHSRDELNEQQTLSRDFWRSWETL